MIHFADYLREQATQYREQAAKAAGALAKQEMLELAELCDELANDVDDRVVCHSIAVPPPVTASSAHDQGTHPIDKT